MRNVQFIVIVVVFLWVAPAAAGSGIVWPPANAPVDGDTTTIVVAGKPGASCRISIDGRPWRTAPLYDDGRRSFEVPIPDGDVQISASLPETGESSVWLRRGESPLELKPPEMNGAPLERAEIYWPEPGPFESIETTLVAGGPPGQEVEVYFGSDLLATASFDATGVLEMKLATEWWTPGELEVRTDTGVAMVYMEPSPSAHPPVVVSPLPRADEGRGLRLGINLALFIGTGLTSTLASVGEEPRRLDRDRAALVSLVNVGVMPFLYFAAYLFREPTPDAVVPIAATLLSGLAAWAGAHYVSGFEIEGSEYAFLAPPFVTFAVALIAYEKAYEWEQRQSFEVVSGPGDTGLSLRWRW